MNRFIPHPSFIVCTIVVSGERERERAFIIHAEGVDGYRLGVSCPTLITKSMYA